MEMIVGLGNPGTQYRCTRHNIGFLVLNRVAINIVGNDLKWKKKHIAHLLNIRYKEKNIILVKPQTFMNLSGKSVREIADYYNIHFNRILIIYDDFNLPLGMLRIRKNGSSGGHHGMDSIINNLQTPDFPRLRIGIGNDNLLRKMGYADFVLSNFLPDEEKLVEITITRAAQAVEDILNHSLQYAMREHNSFKQDEV